MKRLHPCIAALTLIFSAVLASSASQTSANDDYSNRVKLQKLLEAYLRPYESINDWWLESAPNPSIEIIKALTQKTEEIRKTVNSGRKVSKSTQEIASTFPNFYSSIFNRGLSMSFSQGSNRDLGSFKGMEICYIPRNEFRTARFPSLLFYREDWKSIMVAGVRWPKVFLTGFVYHELSHALKHRNRSVVVMSQSRDQWFEEEVTAHELEGDVINSYSLGKYYSALDRMIARTTTRNPLEFLASLTVRELLELYSIIGAEKSGAQIRSFSTAQHLVVLGFRFIDKKKSGNKVALYRWVAQN